MDPAPIGNNGGVETLASRKDGHALSTLFAIMVVNAKPCDRDYKLAAGSGLDLLVPRHGDEVTYPFCTAPRFVQNG